MHVVRIDGHFSEIYARSEAGYESRFIALKDILSEKQKDFQFADIDGTLISIYYPDYMDGINAAGWHMHFLSEDKRKGGHVFDISMTRGNASFCKITEAVPNSV